jgi:predicted ATPase
MPDNGPKLDQLIEMGGSATVRNAEITNFRSVRNASLDLGRLTVLIGANGAGKSNVVDAFRFVSESLSLGLFTALERRAGVRAVRHRSVRGRPRHVHMAMDLDFPNGMQAHYGFRIDSHAGGAYRVGEEICRLATSSGTEFGVVHLRNGKFVNSPFVSVEDFDQNLADVFVGLVSPGPELLALPLIGAIPGLRSVLGALRSLRTYAIVPDRLREPQDPDEGRVLHPDGRNATSVLRSLDSEDRKELLELLGHAAPGVEGVRTVSHGKKLTLEFTQRAPGGRMKFEAHQMSDGTLRLFGILLALLQPEPSTVLAIEEPESTIHVAALEAVVEVLRARSDSAQILLTTHSSDILDFVDTNELRLVRLEGGHTVVSGIAAHSKKAVLDELFTLGELHRAGALQGAGEPVSA